ncbi:MAG: hypothetical protein J7578_00005, partial [Chitinophagaceae bacterium]|nr:hypothetical protein [Chitinophagaceae bacterium]
MKFILLSVFLLLSYFLHSQDSLEHYNCTQGVGAITIGVYTHSKSKGFKEEENTIPPEFCMQTIQY